MILPNKWYDVLKWVAQILLPALASFIIGFGQIWDGIINIPYPAEIAATVTLIDTFLGVLLGISSSNYYKGDAEKGNADEG